MKNLVLTVLLGFCLSAAGQSQIDVVSFKQSTSDIAARTNQRDDVNGVPCALIKVQFPIQGATFIGDIAGEVAFKTNSYWVYMPQNSTQLEIRQKDCKPMTVVFKDYGISNLTSKETYELCLLKQEKDAPQLYNEGMIALSKNDIMTAMDNLQKAADAGYAPASYMLGFSCITPFNPNEDSDPNSTDLYQEAYDCYKKSAQQNYPEAQLALGKMLIEYNNGYTENLSAIKVDKDLLESARIWSMIKAAADKGNTDAQWMMISDEDWCKENAEKGNAIAEFGMGFRNDDALNEAYDKIPWEMNSDEAVEGRNKDYANAYNWYKLAAEHGLDAAQWRLSDMLAQGLGTEKNVEQAIMWREKAANQGNVLYQFMMGAMYSLGGMSDYSSYFYPDAFHYKVEIPKDNEKANYWLRLFSTQPLTRVTQEGISLEEQIYDNGFYQDVITSLVESLIAENKMQKAIYWLQRDCEKGAADALCRLGELYMDGIGIEKNYTKARELLEKAEAHEGDQKVYFYNNLKSRVKANLGIIYRDGLGVEKDSNKAKSYLTSSAENGDHKGRYELALLYLQEGNKEEAIKLLQVNTHTEMGYDWQKYSKLSEEKLNEIQ